PGQDDHLLDPLDARGREALLAGGDHPQGAAPGRRGARGTSRTVRPAEPRGALFPPGRTRPGAGRGGVQEPDLLGRVTGPGAATPPGAPPPKSTPDRPPGRRHADALVERLRDLLPRGPRPVARPAHAVHGLRPADAALPDPGDGHAEVHRRLR